MSKQDVTMETMQWRAPLIRLTQIASPDSFGGEPTIAFIDPNNITTIQRVLGAFFKRDVVPQERHPEVECTLITMCHGYIHVTETPEIVAMLRDKALGHEQKPQAVV